MMTVGYGDELTPSAAAPHLLSSRAAAAGGTLVSQKAALKSDSFPAAFSLHRMSQRHSDHVSSDYNWFRDVIRHITISLYAVSSCC